MWIRFIVSLSFTIILIISLGQSFSQPSSAQANVHHNVHGSSLETENFTSLNNEQSFHDASSSPSTTSESSFDGTSDEHLPITPESASSFNEFEEQTSVNIDKYTNTLLQIDKTTNEEEHESIVQSDPTILSNLINKHQEEQHENIKKDFEQKDKTFESIMNVKNDQTDHTFNSGSLFIDLYEYSLGIFLHISNIFNEFFHFKQNHSQTSNNYSNDNSLILFRVIESLAALCAFTVCLVVCYICRTRPDSKYSKWLRYVNVLSLFCSLITAIGSCLKFFIKSPENIEIQINSDNAAAYSMQGRRGGMEDRFTLKNCVSNEFGIEFYAVYDGHGGPNAAAYAEKELFSRITRRIKWFVASESSTKENSKSKVKVRTPLKEVKNLLNRMTTDVNRFDILNVNELKNIINDEIISFDAKLVDEFTKKQDISGTTALIVVRIVKTNTLLVANVGDSRAILCDWKNATIPLSFDHKPDKLKEYRRVMEAGGCVILRGVLRVNGILAVSRALGDYPLKNNRIVIPDPDILTFDLDDLRPRFMIIASDGFWDTFSNENAVQFVRNELSHYGTNYVAKGSCGLAAQIARKLAQESYNRESYDNITVIVVLFEELDGITKSRVGMAKKSK